jgi:DinB family protein
MRSSMSATATAIALSLVVATAARSQANPVSSTFRAFAANESKNLLAAAEAMPADKYSFKPTPAQLTFGGIIVHIAGDNHITCSAIAGLKPDVPAKVSPTAPKEEQLAALRSSIEFCQSTLAKVTDAMLADTVSWYGGKSKRVGAMIGLVEDWSDHYSQQAGYLRLNGILPPTAKKEGM